jgi:hypothetical protein
MGIRSIRHRFFQVKIANDRVCMDSFDKRVKATNRHLPDVEDRIQVGTKSNIIAFNLNV